MSPTTRCGDGDPSRVKEKSPMSTEGNEVIVRRFLEGIFSQGIRMW